MSNKKSALDKAIQAVSKKYGNDMSNYADLIEEKPIVSYSTGSRLLDLAISSGQRAGFPEGRMIELYGPESSGKCVTSDTYILTPTGYKTLETIFEENGTPIEVKEEELTAEIPLINRYGEEESTYAITFNGEQEVLEVTTKHGYSIKVTKNHPLLVNDEWVKAEDLEIGQPLSVLAGTQRYNEADKKTDEIQIITTTNDNFLQQSREDTINFIRAGRPDADVNVDVNKGLVELKGNEDELRRIQLAYLNEGIISSLFKEEEEWVLKAEVQDIQFDEEKEPTVFKDAIVSIESVGKKPTFDVAMPDTQSFIGNGLINHNTTIALLAIAERQRIENARAEADPDYLKKRCVFMDAEFALDEDLAIQYGVDLSDLVIIRPDQAEDGMDILDSYIRTGEVALAVVDSVSALVPAIIEQSSFQQKEMATLARFMSQVSTRLSGPAWRNGTTILFINQIREKVGAWSPTGQPVEGTPGGRGLKFHSTLRIRVRRGETIGKVDAPEGHVMNIKIVKNKIDNPGGTAAVKLYYGLGVDTVEELGEIAIAYGIATQGGAWFKVVDRETGELLELDGEVANFQGRERFFEAIEQNTKLRNYLEEAIENFEVED